MDVAVDAWGCFVNCVLTLIVPAFDMEAWLDTCLSSVAPRPGTFLPPYEVVVVNDGSRDRTSEIAHEWQRRHPNVFRVLDKDNGHYGSCVNAALPLAEGLYVKVLDADDAFDPEAFADYLKRLAARADIPDVVVSDVARWDAEGKSAGEYRYALPPAFGMDELLGCARTITHHALAYRTALLRQMDYRQTEGVPYTDTEWFTLPMAHVRSGVHFDCLLYRYRIQRPGQSVEASAYARDVDALVKVFDRMCAAYLDKTAVAAANSAYLLEQLKRLALLIGSVCLLEVPSRRAEAVLAPFLAHVAVDLPDVLAELDAARVFSWSPFPLRHLRFWRRHPRMRLPLVVLLRAYARLIPRYRGRASGQAKTL